MFHAALTERWVSQVAIADETCKLGEKSKISCGKGCTSNMSSSIGPSGIILVSEGLEVFDSLVENGLLGSLDENSCSHLSWLVITVGFKEPHHLILFGSVGRNDSVFSTQEVEDSFALVVVGSIVSLVDWKGVTSAISAGSLSGSPFFRGKSNVLELNTLVAK